MLGFFEPVAIRLRPACLFVPEPRSGNGTQQNTWRGINDVRKINLDLSDFDVKFIIDHDEFDLFRGSHSTNIEATAPNFFIHLLDEAHPIMTCWDRGSNMDAWQAMVSYRGWQNMSAKLVSQAYAWTILGRINKEEFELVTGKTWERDDVRDHDKLVISQFLAWAHEMSQLPRPEQVDYAKTFGLYRSKA